MQLSVSMFFDRFLMRTQGLHRTFILILIFSFHLRGKSVMRWLVILFNISLNLQTNVQIYMSSKNCSPGYCCSECAYLLRHCRKGLLAYNLFVAFLSNSDMLLHFSISLDFRGFLEARIFLCILSFKDADGINY